jgi:hypothetical protein
MLKGPKSLGFGMIAGAIVLAAIWLSVGATVAVVVGVLLLVLGGLALVR